MNGYFFVSNLYFLKSVFTSEFRQREKLLTEECKINILTCLYWAEIMHRPKNREAVGCLDTHTSLDLGSSSSTKTVPEDPWTSLILFLFVIHFNILVDGSREVLSKLKSKHKREIT